MLRDFVFSPLRHNEHKDLQANFFHCTIKEIIGGYPYHLTELLVYSNHKNDVI
jgi:hypothetical protein